MNRETLLSLYDRFTGLVEKLPGGLQKPILRELVPIREVFLEQRPARLMILGGSSKSIPEFLRLLCKTDVETGDAVNGWRTYRIPHQGEISILDARNDVPKDLVDGAVANSQPDILIYLRESNDRDDAIDLAGFRASLCGRELPVVGIAYGEPPARARLAALMSAHGDFSFRKNFIFSPGTGDLPDEIALLLPNSARLEFARLTGAKNAQAQIAGSILKSFTAVCGVIGLQPIPLADMPVLTALQTLMVSLIIHASGKTVSPRLAAEFIGALGLNVGAGILFRESARAIIKVVPLWGNAVSGFVAGAGTYAIGRAAIAYFIEETPINETKRLFHKLLPGWDAFKRRRLPALGNSQKTPEIKNTDAE